MVSLIEIQMLVEWIWSWGRLECEGKRETRREGYTYIVTFSFKKVLCQVSSSPTTTYKGAYSRTCQPYSPCPVMDHSSLDRGGQPLKGQGPMEAWHRNDFQSKEVLSNSDCVAGVNAERSWGWEAVSPGSQSHEGFKCLSKQQLHSREGQRAGLQQ